MNKTLKYITLLTSVFTMSSCVMSAGFLSFDAFAEKINEIVDLREHEDYTYGDNFEVRYQEKSYHYVESKQQNLVATDFQIHLQYNYGNRHAARRITNLVKTYSETGIASIVTSEEETHMITTKTFNVTDENNEEEKVRYFVSAVETYTHNDMGGEYHFTTAPTFSKDSEVFDNDLNKILVLQDFDDLRKDMLSPEYHLNQFISFNSSLDENNKTEFLLNRDDSIIGRMKSEGTTTDTAEVVISGTEVVNVKYYTYDERDILLNEVTIAVSFTPVSPITFKGPLVLE